MITSTNRLFWLLSIRWVENVGYTAGLATLNTFWTPLFGLVILGQKIKLPVLYFFLGSVNIIGIFLILKIFTMFLNEGFTFSHNNTLGIFFLNLPTYDRSKYACPRHTTKTRLRSLVYKVPAVYSLQIFVPSIRAVQILLS